MNLRTSAPPHLRTSARLTAPYATYNREERNLAAIFFYALNLGDNTKRFLHAADCKPPDASWDPAVYYEFAQRRDLWNRIDNE